MDLGPHCFTALLVLQLLNLVGFLVQRTFLHIMGKVMAEVSLQSEGSVVKGCMTKGKGKGCLTCHSSSLKSNAASWHSYDD